MSTGFLMQISILYTKRYGQNQWNALNSRKLAHIKTEEPLPIFGCSKLIKKVQYFHLWFDTTL